MKTAARVLLISILLSLWAIPAWAHFAATIPSDDIITLDDNKTVTLSLRFMHPFENNYLKMDKPGGFSVTARGRSTDLMKGITSVKRDDGNAWETSYTIRRPGDYVFVLESAPYFEASEELFIIQYAKLYINALGMSGAWDIPMGTPVEIVPMVQPYGLWTGNIFTGRVLVNGKPAPHMMVEVELMNTGETGSVVKAPAAPYITQSVLTDDNGVFSYAMPREGWWGFAAITETSRTLKLKDRPYAVEEGGVIWVRVRDMN